MKRILIIEDDPITAKFYRTLLEKEGCQVEVATDGQKGFDRLVESKPDGVLLDLMLPSQSGNVLIQKIRALDGFKDLPIVAFTNAFVTPMVDGALRSGATKVYDKSSITRLMLIEAFRDKAAASTA